MDPPNARRYDVAGCHLAALVLERLQYWAPRTRVRKRGKAWIVKSRADLMHETRLTEKQIRTSLEKLKARDLVEIEQLPFAGKNVAHIRFTPRGMLSLAKAGFTIKIDDSEEPQVAQEGQPEMASEGQPEMAPQGQLIIQGDIDKGLYTGNSTSYGGAIANDFSEKVPRETKAMKEPRKPRVNPQTPKPEQFKPRNSDDVVTMLKAKKPAPKPGKPVPLGTAWQEAMVEFYPGEFHTALKNWPTPRLDTR